MIWTNTSSSMTFEQISWDFIITHSSVTIFLPMYLCKTFRFFSSIWQTNKQKIRCIITTTFSSIRVNRCMYRLSYHNDLLKWKIPYIFARFLFISFCFLRFVEYKTVSKWKKLISSNVRYNISINGFYTWKKTLNSVQKYRRENEIVSEIQLCDGKY